MNARGSLVTGVLFVIGAVVSGCSGAASSASPAPSAQPQVSASAAPSAATVPSDFPLGVWTTTITEADLRAGGVTSEGDLAENAGTFTMTLAADGTWTSAQDASVPVRWPIFKGTWTATGPDSFNQVTTFPPDFAGDSVDFTWKIQDGSLILKVVNPPDPILPVIVESNPWQRAG